MNKSQVVYKLSSILLHYPDKEWKEYLSLLYEEASLIDDAQVRGMIENFLDYLDRTSMEKLCQNYVLTFDFNDRSTLYLTYSVFKDNRERGPALVKLRNEFLQAGADLESDELPDYLPLILEFASITETEKSAKILKLHFRAIERLCLELESMNSPYHHLLGACVLCIKRLRSNEQVSKSGERRII
ncbi:nitrate reductase molybdenum cofactor assembly chaperone [Mesobacillus sp. AQ2]|uniref:nitrate reductase molybdenum cofactor assembly chaperone n=1 Tax=Bacillaceae TaxID=186817 RepID=UPI00119DE74C|nr:MULTISPECIES: nitrate reductase molybdenum cofactor assembly chaperone [Bacillaceae]MCM3124998.1 nitrate reductase molybdenum cofactor assembly chaperone [Mesobacillus sp. MER 33]MCM3235242.1 nitrate reductase molybdenum cofactor assembly chaperone [Mesobacillus sp. MER 48]WHX39831.1 nitrate reductase molybdenum cofactor assembly chaperone [Mesobacillus sp. AQ2]